MSEPIRDVIPERLRGKTAETLTEADVRELNDLLDAPETHALRLETYASNVEDEGLYSTASVMRKAASVIRKLAKDAKA
jgi:hypothetical protein